jgi:hypothetical protein
MSIISKTYLVKYSISVIMCVKLCLLVPVKSPVVGWWIYFNQTRIIKRIILLNEFEFIVAVLSYIRVEYLRTANFKEVYNHQFLA